MNRKKRREQHQQGKQQKENLCPLNIKTLYGDNHVCLCLLIEDNKLDILPVQVLPWEEDYCEDFDQ